MKRRARVLIDASAARMGGGISRLNELNTALSLVAPHNEYIFAVGPSVAERLRRSPTPPELVVVPRALPTVAGRLLWQNLRLPRFASATGVDHLISPFGVLPLGPGLNGIRRSVILSNIGPFSPEITARLHGYQAARNRALKTMTLRSLRIADNVFLLSGEARSLMAPALRDKTTTMLPMSPPSPELVRSAQVIDRPAGLEPSTLFCAFGDLLPYKGFEDAIRAVGSLRSLGTKVDLIICGNPLDTDYVNELRAVARREAPHGVRFLHGVQQVQVLGLMHRAVGTIVSSRVENTSRVPVEAMAMGSPVVSADIPNARESCGDAALYYRPGDRHQLSAHLATLLDDPARRTALVAQGHAQIGTRDWTSATRVLLETLELDGSGG